MKATKAIEILELELPEYLSNPETDLMHAIKLGREALKAIPEYRKRLNELRPSLLPGEDPDDS